MIRSTTKAAGESVFLYTDPKALFWGFILLHLLVWTLLPALLNANLPLDVIEALAWGREWQWGYYKHPPLSAWLAELAAFLSGGSDWGIYLLSQLCIAVGFWAMWRLAGEFLDPLKAVLSVLLLEGIAYHSYTSPEFNVNVSMLAFWALTILYFRLAITRHSLAAWLLCGLFAGLGFLSKYLIVFLLLPLFLYLVFEPEHRKEFTRPGLYLGLVLFLLIISPHLVWVLDNNLITINYGLRRTGSEDTSALYRHTVHPLKFLVGQLLYLLPALLLTASLVKTDFRKHFLYSPDHRFVALVFLGPILCYFLLSLATGMKIRTMWGTPLFVASGLFLMLATPAISSAWKFKRFSRTWAIVFLLFPVAYASVHLLSSQTKETGKRTHFPGMELATLVTDSWHKQFGKPLEYVIGNEWLAGNIGWYSEDRPSVYLDGDLTHAPWISRQGLLDSGAVLIWQADRETSLDKGTLRLFGADRKITIMPDLYLSWHTPNRLPPIQVHWAILAPGKQP